jgi:hypothetical protein
MPYDLMLLADPGPSRDEVLRAFDAAPDLTVDPSVDYRYFLQTTHGPALVNIGSKDPVESVHVEFELDDLDLCEAATFRALDLADSLGMRVEDVQWGHEVTRADVPALRRHWAEVAARTASLLAAGPTKKPWWRPW